MALVCIDNNFILENEASLLIDNRSYRYGDGFFETLKIVNQKILFKQAHQKRIVKAIAILDIPYSIDLDQIFDNIISLCDQNGCSSSARVRLSFSIGNGALNSFDTHLNYLIECYPLDTVQYKTNPQGLTATIYTDCKKTTDSIANIKSASAVVLAMASRYAVKNKKTDSFIINTNHHIIETTIANIFCIKKNKILTPPLSDGCVDGIIRNLLFQNFDITEQSITESVLKKSDAVIVTNTIRGAQWIQSVNEINFSYPKTILNKINLDLLNSFIQ